MDYREAVAYLDSHIGAGIRPGLERIERLVDLMGDPHRAYPVIHIAGTNGKTSTTRLVSAILMGHGLRVGSTTSPHLEGVEERLAIDGVAASPEELAHAVEDIHPFVELFKERYQDSPTYFEITTLLALSYFASQAVDVAVVEVGLGGRLDATNDVEGKVSVVTGISLEHTEYLGTTVGEIAAEKAAIAKPGTVIVAGNLPEEARVAVRDRAAQVDAPVRFIHEDFGPSDPLLAVGGWVATYGGVYGTYEEVFLPLHGIHQVDNLAVAIAACEELFGRELSDEGLREGLGDVTVPGRLEVVSRHPAVLIDGAHNPNGFASLVDALETEFRMVDWTCVLGAMADKDIESMVSQLDGHVSTVVTTAVDDPRAIQPEALAELARTHLDVEVEAVAGVDSALARAVALAGDEGAVLVTGSLYLVGEARGIILRGGGAQRSQ